MIHSISADVQMTTRKKGRQGFGGGEPIQERKGNRDERKSKKKGKGK